MTARRLFALFLPPALALAAAARADPLELRWNSCDEIQAVPVQSFSCDSNSGGTFDLIYSVNPFTVMTNVDRADIRLWIQSSQPALPSYWHLESGGCRAGALSLDPAAPYPAGCTDPWLGAAAVTADVRWLDCRPSGLLIDLHAVLPPGTTRSLVPGTRYAMFRLRFDRSHTIGADACGGCNLIATFGVGGISIGSAAGGGWSMSPASYAAWQSNVGPYADSPNCGPTRLRPSTWGTIHSLYR